MADQTEAEWWEELKHSTRPVTLADLLRHAANDPKLSDDAFAVLVEATEDDVSG